MGFLVLSGSCGLPRRTSANMLARVSENEFAASDTVSSLIREHVI